MKKSISMQACYMMASMMGLSMMGGPGSKHYYRKKKELLPEDKERIQAQYQSELHTYTIHGIKIQARSKKDALKKFNAKCL